VKARIPSYPHFDGALSDEDAKALASSPEAVCKHAFYPFLEYKKRWTRFGKKGQQGVPKERPIRYAARRDFCIFAHYRGILQRAYEEQLIELGMSDSILAYRRIPTASGAGNKCNIHYAKDAFDRIAQIGDCYVYALDISKFFESLEHARIKEVWASLLEVKTSKFPSDHYRVYEAITKFACVDRDKTLRALGYFKSTKGSAGKSSASAPSKKVRLCLCSGSEFREKVKSLIVSNKENYGIPQGAPLSDVIANSYLIDFDKALRGIANNAGGCYYRYSDDILLVMPAQGEDFKARLREIQDLIRAQGSRLCIQDKKSSIFRFFSSIQTPQGGRRFDLVFGSNGKNGLEYLGFRFDGRAVYLRDSTISGLNRKIVASAKRQARSHVAKRPHMSLAQLQACFDYKSLIERFGRIREFEILKAEYSTWTFITYVKRSIAIFGSLGRPIAKQMAGHRAFIRRKADEELSRLAQ